MSSDIKKPLNKGITEASRNQSEFNKAINSVTSDLKQHVVYCYENHQKKNGSTERVYRPVDEWLQEVTIIHQVSLNNRRQFTVGILNNRLFEKSDFIKYLQILANYGGGDSRHFSKDLLLLYVDQFIEKFNRNHKLKTIEELSFKKDQQQFGISELERVLVGSIGVLDPLDKAVVLHWIWQVKRKMLGLSVDHHMMLVFYGDQGGGKTQLILKLLSPIKGLYFPTNFLQIIDDRLFKVVRDYAVIFTDEMAGAEKACINLVKNRISSETVTGRPLFSNEIEEVPNNATWIGATNFPIEEIIRDESGNRRFYQLSCLPKGGWDWDAINTSDYLGIWQAVDENDVSPLIKLDLVSAIHDRQKSLWRHKSLVEEFLIEKDLVPKPGQQDVYFIQAAMFREDFAWWLKSMGKNSYMPSSGLLGRQLKKAGIMDHKRFVDGRQVRGYLVSRNLRAEAIKLQAEKYSGDEEISATMTL